MNKLTRRNFIQTVSVGCGSLLLFPRCTGLVDESPWRFFTLKEASIVDAITEQVIPANEWSGAKDAGVTNYIDKQLIGPYTRFQEKYRKGLAFVDLTCQNLYHKSFEDLGWDQQTLFLEKMEAGQLPDIIKSSDQKVNQIWDNGFDSQFFNLICDHTMQGFYGSPRHGGNRENVSYRMIGLDYPFIVGQNRY